MLFQCVAATTLRLAPRVTTLPSRHRINDQLDVNAIPDWVDTPDKLEQYMAANFERIKPQQV